MTARRLLLAAAAAAVLSSFAAATGAASNAPAGAFFIVNCRYSHTGPDDPIVLPKLPGRSHDHTFIGNSSTTAFSTPATLARHPRTSCSDTDDLSSYWAPTLYAAAKRVLPLDVTIYYRRLTAAPVRPFPAGLQMVAGNSRSFTRQRPSVTTWYCGVLKSSFYGPMVRGGSAAVPTLSAAGLPRCTPPTNLELQVNFPDCSDGRATSADHASHMAYSRAGRCPASHPIPVPAISIILRYPPITSTNVFLSSGGIWSGHADFMDAWKPAAFRTLVTDCLDHYVGCGAAASGALDVTTNR